VIVAEAGFAAQTGVLAEPIAGLALQRLSLDNLKTIDFDICICTCYLAWDYEISLYYLKYTACVFKNIGFVTSD
jgi:hypothetical protein